MPEEITPLSPPMEGKGSYNKYAKLPAGGAALALPLLEKAAEHVVLDRSSRPIVIADYGSSQGKNSLAPMRLIIRTLRPRIGQDRPIMVFHIDQATIFLRERASRRIGPSRVVVICRGVAKPHSNADPQSFHFSPDQWRGPR
jgi:hypothetical protein